MRYHDASDRRVPRSGKEPNVSVELQGEISAGSEDPTSMLRARVSAELEAILRPLSPPAPARSGSVARGRGFSPNGIGAQRRSSRLIIGLAIGAVIGGIVTFGLRSSHSSAAHEPLRPSQSFARPALPAGDGSAGRRAIAGPTTEDRRAEARAPIPSPAPVIADLPAPAPDQARPAGRPNEERKPRSARPLPERPRSARALPPTDDDPAPTADARAPAARPCEPNGSAAWCLRDATAQADERLRQAYYAAVSAGADRSALAAIRRDWSRLRGRALKDPQALLRGYRALTDELHHEADEASQ